MTTNQMDPDVPILRDALTKLQAGVAAGGLTHRAANEALGKLADSLVQNRRVSQFQTTTHRRRRMS